VPSWGSAAGVIHESPAVSSRTHKSSAVFRALEKIRVKNSSKKFFAKNFHTRILGRFSCTHEIPAVFRALEKIRVKKFFAKIFYTRILGRFSCTHEIPAVFQKSMILRENFENSTISCVECLGVLARETSIFASTISVGPRYLVDPASGDMLR